MPRRRTIRVLGALALVLLGGPASASADQTIASLAAPAPVSVAGERVVWSAFDPATGRYRLMTAFAGAVSAVPVATRGVPFDVDVGPDRSGGAVATYSRCRHEPPRRDNAISNAVAQMPNWSGGRGCDLYLFNFSTGHESKIGAPSTSGASEFLPSIWNGRIAFARVYERRRGRAGDRAYLYVRAVTGAGRSVRVPAGSRSSLVFCSSTPRRCRTKLEPGPTVLDLAGRRLAFGWDSGDGSGPTSSVYLATIVSTTARKVLLDRGTSGDIQAEEIVSAAVFDGQVFWMLTRYGDTTSNTSRRYRISARTLGEAQVPAPGPPDAFIRPILSSAVVGQDLFYLASGLVPVGEPCTPQSPCLAQPGCSPAQPCALGVATNLTYRTYVGGGSHSGGSTGGI